jgi:hypothetical protein
MVERRIALSYCKEKNYINESNLHRLTFAKPYGSGFIYSFMKDKVDLEVFNKQIFLYMPVMRVYNNGVQLATVNFTSRDVFLLCEEGLSFFSEGYCVGGQPVVPEQECSVSSDDGDEDLPKIRLYPLIDNPNIVLSTWKELIKYELEDYEISISNYNVIFMKKREGIDTPEQIKKKKWTFMEFYLNFYQMNKDSEREMAFKLYLEQEIEESKQNKEVHEFEDGNYNKMMRNLGYGMFNGQGQKKLFILDSGNSRDLEGEEDK